MEARNLTEDPMWDTMMVMGARQPPRMVQSLWERAFNEHHEHAGFRMEGWPAQRLVGFSCSCGRQHENDDEMVWQIPLTALRGMPREVRERFQHVGMIHPPVDLTRLTPEEAARLAPELRARRDRELLDMKQAVVASKRAEKLLRRHLDRKQKADLKKAGHFFVEASDGHTYRIDQSSSWNVARVENGKITATFCIVFRDFRIPTADKMLIQKFMLQSSLDDFMRIANKNHHQDLIMNPRNFVVQDGFAQPMGEPVVNLDGLERLELEAQAREDVRAGDQVDDQIDALAAAMQAQVQAPVQVQAPERRRNRAA